MVEDRKPKIRPLPELTILRHPQQRQKHLDGISVHAGHCAPILQVSYCCVMDAVLEQDQIELRDKESCRDRPILQKKLAIYLQVSLGVSELLQRIWKRQDSLISQAKNFCLGGSGQRNKWEEIKRICFPLRNQKEQPPEA